MKRKALVMAALAAAITASAANLQWTIAGKTFSVDTLEHYKIGPGTTMTVLALQSGSTKEKLWVTTSDLTAEGLEVRSTCGKGPLKSTWQVSKQIEAQKGDGHIYFAAINSDLFSTTGPIGTTVLDGEIYKTAKGSTAWRAMAIDESQNKLIIGNPGVQFGAKLNGKTEYAPSLVNVPRETGECILYTRRWGSTTGTKSGDAGVEVVLRPADGILYSDQPTECVVMGSPEVNKGNRAIPEGCIVLSSNIANHIRDLSKLANGDKYVITPRSWSLEGVGFANTHQFNEMKWMNGGNCELIADGELRPAVYSYTPGYNGRRPRTGIGTDASKQRMMMVVVDGDAKNSGISAGMTTQELAETLKSLGCTEALYLDGGGSSTMYTSFFGVINRPSDSAGERAVSTTWCLTTPDKGDNTVASIEFVDPHKTLAIGAKYTPSFYGYNAAGLLVAKNVAGVTLSAPAGLGTVSADGKTLTVTGNGTYALKASVGGKTCSIAIRAGNYLAGVAELDSLGENDEPAQYFDMQGRPVDNPVAGVYICRRGSKTYKIIL